MSKRDRDADLHAWFAKADDVLADWQGSEDAMSVRGEPDDADPELPLLGDNRADQTWPLPRGRSDAVTRVDRPPVRAARWGLRVTWRVARGVLARIVPSA